MWNVSASFRIVPKTPLHNHSRLSLNPFSLFSVTHAASDINSIRSWYVCSSLAYTKYFIVCSSIPFRSGFVSFLFVSNEWCCRLLFEILFVVCVCVLEHFQREKEKNQAYTLLCLPLHVHNNMKYPHRKHTIPSRRWLFYLFYSGFSLSVVQLSCKGAWMCAYSLTLLLLVILFLFRLGIFLLLCTLCAHICTIRCTKENLWTHTNVRERDWETKRTSSQSTIMIWKKEGMHPFTTERPKYIVVGCCCCCCFFVVGSIYSNAVQSKWINGNICVTCSSAAVGCCQANTRTHTHTSSCANAHGRQTANSAPILFGGVLHHRRARVQ